MPTTKQMLEKFLTTKQSDQPHLQKRADEILSEFRRYLDTNADHVLSKAELEKIHGTDTERIFKIMDLDHNGKISEQEYLQYCIMKDLVAGLMPKFKAMDYNKDGTVTEEELRRYLQEQNYSATSINEAVKKADKDGNHVISYMELADYLIGHKCK